LADIDDVRRYWDRFPLLSHEIGEIGTPAFFETLDRIKRMDSERFALPFWEFEKFRGKLKGKIALIGEMPLYWRRQIIAISVLIAPIQQGV